MAIIKKVKDAFKNAFTQGWTVEKLSLSFCMGVYIAFSPFPGAHTIMMFIAKWLFNINFPILFIATSFNNPWTMIPFYSLDYVFGYWFIHDFLGLNPGWAVSLAKIFGSGKICVWSFFVGGNVLGLVIAFLMYPLVKLLFNKLVVKFEFLEKK